MDLDSEMNAEPKTETNPKDLERSQTLPLKDDSFSALQWQNNLTYECWSLRPHKAGGSAATSKLGAPPQTPLGLSPKPRSRGGLAAEPPAGFVAEPQARFGAEPQRVLGAEPPASHLRRSRRWSGAEPPASHLLINGLYPVISVHECAFCSVHKIVIFGTDQFLLP
ncbi:MAG: hypothetical protein GY696_27400 [Gammaproteobacteria bacterium]|nr:hypothetical protein [Gammaproteobacteria bacterium]